MATFKNNYNPTIFISDAVRELRTIKKKGKSIEIPLLINNASLDKFFFIKNIDFNGNFYTHLKYF